MWRATLSGLILTLVVRLRSTTNFIARVHGPLERFGENLSLYFSAAKITVYDV
jgi:hypothetical protein